MTQKKTMSRSDSAKKYTVGQKLYYASSSRRYSEGDNTGYEVVVTKVGTKWVYFKYSKWVSSCGKPSRFNPTNGRVDGEGYSSPGIVYASEVEHRQTMLRNKLWGKMREAMTYNPPNVPLDSLILACRVLGFDDKEMLK